MDNPEDAADWNPVCRTNPINPKPLMSYSLNSCKGGFYGELYRELFKGILRGILGV